MYRRPAAVRSNDNASMTSATTPVAQPDRGEQRGPPPVEQPAVVGWQADRRVALVDDPAQIVDGRPVARGVGGERIAFVLAPPDAVAHPRPEAVVVVAGIAHREQLTILGVEDEQEPVEERQGRVSHLRQPRLGSGGGDGAGEIGKNAVEDQLRQALGDALFVVRPLVDGPLMERAGNPWRPDGRHRARRSGRTDAARDGGPPRRGRTTPRCSPARRARRRDRPRRTALQPNALRHGRAASSGRW